MPPSRVECICGSGLRPEAIGECLCRVHTMPHPGGLIAERYARRLEEGGVGVADDVPAHPRMVEITEGMYQGLTGTSIVAADGEWEVVEHYPCAAGEGYDALACLRLRQVHRPVAGEGAPDVEDMAVYVAWLEGDGLTPPEAREEDEFRDAAPDAGHPFDHQLDFLKGERVVATGCRGYARPFRGER